MLKTYNSIKGLSGDQSTVISLALRDLGRVAVDASGQPIRLSRISGFHPDVKTMDGYVSIHVARFAILLCFSL